MLTRRIFLVGVALLSIGLLCVALFSLRNTERLRQQLAAATERKTTLRSDLRKAAAQAAASTLPARIDSPKAEQGSKSSPAAKPSALPPPAPTKVPSIMDLARDNPGLWND